MMMSAVLAAMLLSLCAAVIALLLIWGNRWVRGVALVLLCVWGYHAQWWARFAIDARWVDDARSRYQQDAVIAAIKAGRTTIPLAETTNFAWTAVCYLWADHAYAEPDGTRLSHRNTILREVFGTDIIPFLENTSNHGEYFVLVYATPDGPYVVSPMWEERFRQEFQRLYNGRYYAKQLHNNGYVVHAEVNKTSNNRWDNLCFKPDDVWFRITPKTTWRD